MSHVFVMGEDKSFTKAENVRLMEEVETHQDILIAPAEESPTTVSALTKYCIYWVTENYEFDVLIKTNDDSTLFLSRLVGPAPCGGWLNDVERDDLVYFGKKHPVTKVANPANFEPNERVNSCTEFEFDYRGLYWPEYMEGGMYGFSRHLAEELVKNDFRTYTNEDAMVGVWVSGLNAKILYLTDDQVLTREDDFLSKNGTGVVVSFHTDPLRLASMWCEYGPLGTLSQQAMLATDVQLAMDCLGSYHRAALTPRSHPLGARTSHLATTLTSLARDWPITERPDPEQTGQWWYRMRGVFRKRSAVVIGNSATVNRLPLYLLQGMHSVVLDDFFRVSERYERTSWAPTMYMCIDPLLCAPKTDEAGGGAEAGGLTTAAVRVSGGGGTDVGAIASVENVNRFARTMFAAFFIMNDVDGVEYWRYLRQRGNAHWFVAGAGVGPNGKGENADVSAAATMGSVVAMDRSAQQFRALSRRSGMGMSVEVLSYLGFSPIYITGARDEVGTQWDEISLAMRFVASTYGTEVIHLYERESDKLGNAKVASVSSGESGKRGGLGKFSAQENFYENARKRLGTRSRTSANWDLEAFLDNFPVMSRLEVVRGASSVEAMFPMSPRCRDAEDLDRFQKAVLCSVKTSLKHFPSFLTWHVPYGPIRGTFVWAKR